jgi:CBS domain-containing protein
VFHLEIFKVLIVLIYLDFSIYFTFLKLYTFNNLKKVLILIDNNNILGGKTMIKNNILLRDIMTRGVPSVPMDITLREVAKIMVEQNVSGVAVTDHTGEIMGFITEMDMLQVVVDKSLMDKTAEAIMTSSLKSINPSTNIETAANVMLDAHIHRLIILSESGMGASDRPVGILSANDIIRQLTL